MQSLALTAIFLALLCCSCLAEDEVCFQDGVCLNSDFYGDELAKDEIECLQFCKDDFQCNWWTYSQEFGTCFLFRDCQEFDPNYCAPGACITGN